MGERNYCSERHRLYYKKKPEGGFVVKDVKKGGSEKIGEGGRVLTKNGEEKIHQLHLREKRFGKYKHGKRPLLGMQWGGDTSLLNDLGGKKGTERDTLERLSPYLNPNQRGIQSKRKQKERGRDPKGWA